MALVRATRDAFLWCMAVIYLFAFSSFYVQIPGLLGDNGILPARVIEFKEVNSIAEFFRGKPTLLRLMPFLGLTIEKGMDLLCLLGILLSFLCMTIKSFRNSIEYGALWLLYLSLYQVGQTFFYFQWDILLLEAGFLSIIVAPLNMYILIWKTVPYHHHDNISLFLVKWLLFRLMFASGVVKLTSMCPTWWGLTALNYHFESQCIPTPLAWYAHHLPPWLLNLGVTATFLIEIVIPFLFFAPIRHLRKFAFYTQVLLQIGIILTGNYNFFNLLTITLCVSLLDDDFFQKRKSRRSKQKSFWHRVADWVLTAAAYGYLIYILVRYFSLSFGPGYTSLRTKIAFTKTEFSDWLAKTVPYTIILGAISLGIEILVSLVRCWQSEKTLFRRLSSSFGVCLMAGVAALMFVVSLVPYTVIDVKSNTNLMPQIKTWHRKLDHLHLTSSYGLFRVMTGVGGRPEVIIEGSNDMKDWKEYDFLYKPGNLTKCPAFVAPHQPRLDWQMWFAALGNYQHNPWLLTFCYRLLTGQPEVLQLIKHNPFPEKPPQYLRAKLHHYHYTSPKQMSVKYSKVDWWTRESVNEYLPILVKNDQGLQEWLQQNGIFQPIEKMKHSNLLVKAVSSVRNYFGQPEGFTFVMSIFSAGLTINLISKYFHY